MTKNSLESFIEEIVKVWGPLSTQTVASSTRLFSELLKAPSTETWLMDLLESSGVSKELYRDPVHGFVLSAYSDPAEFYRVPHDHGSGWVIYGVQSGLMEMGTYIRSIDTKGRLHLVRREIYELPSGESRVFLPGDIHHTRCLSKSVTVLRLTSSDFRIEEEEGRMIKYVDYERNAV